jgi:hypothetical protein
MRCVGDGDGDGDGDGGVNQMKTEMIYCKKHYNLYSNA